MVLGVQGPAILCNYVIRLRSSWTYRSTVKKVKVGILFCLRCSDMAFRSLDEAMKAPNPSIFCPICFPHFLLSQKMFSGSNQVQISSPKRQVGIGGPFQARGGTPGRGFGRNQHRRDFFSDHYPSSSFIKKGRQHTTRF